MILASLVTTLAIHSTAVPASPLDDLRAHLATPAAERKPLADQPFAKAPLSKADSQAAADLLYADSLARLKAERKTEWDGKSVTAAGKTMTFEYRVFGEAPKRGRALFISMHGGGNAAPAVNDAQWKNQIALYQPKEGVYLAPRAPTDTWNLWHEPHIDALFDRLIEDAIACAGVDPDRVYLMGYSAGGDGVYQLAPRMADRFAAAAMMAGHPNDASPLGLRNLPFAIHVGANDSGYNRNKVAREWGEKLDQLQNDDPDGYTHVVKLHANRGHWMNLQDSEAVPWMYGFTRDPVPATVVWKQDGRTQNRFYWLALDDANVNRGTKIIASIKDNVVALAPPDDVHAVTILLNDRLADLDKPVSYHFARPRSLTIATIVTSHRPEPRTIANLATSLAERPADKTLYPVRFTINLSSPEPTPFPIVPTTPK